MHDVDLIDPPDGGDIHTDHIVAVRNELEQRLTYLPKSATTTLFFVFMTFERSPTNRLLCKQCPEGDGIISWRYRLFICASARASGRTPSTLD